MDVTLHNNNVLDKLYNEVMEEINQNVKTDHLLISLDESTDLHNKSVVNVLVSSLKNDQPYNLRLMRVLSYSEPVYNIDISSIITSTIYAKKIQ